jgi:fatty acid-binding protein DegV
MTKAIDKMIDILKEKVGNYTPVRIAIQHANAYEEANSLQTKVINSFPADAISEIMIADVSPVIGTHLGPGVVGVSFMAGM